MDNRQDKYEDEPDELLMNDDADFIDEELDNEQVERASRSRAFNLDMRHRIEDRLEQRRLMKELNDYEFFDLDDDDTLH